MKTYRYFSISSWKFLKICSYTFCFYYTHRYYFISYFPPLFLEITSPKIVQIFCLSFNVIFHFVRIMFNANRSVSTGYLRLHKYYTLYSAKYRINMSVFYLTVRAGESNDHFRVCIKYSTFVRGVAYILPPFGEIWVVANHRVWCSSTPEVLALL